jgi:uncharacterized protein YbjT (DUF2867 family)
MPMALHPHTTRRKRPALLIVGCGDVGSRVARLVAGRWRVLALTSTPERVPALRELGAVPLVGDLDRPETLARLAGLADAVLHLAPPPAGGTTDPRTASLVRALAAAPASAASSTAAPAGSTATAAAPASTKPGPSARAPTAPAAGSMRSGNCGATAAAPAFR